MSGLSQFLTKLFGKYTKLVVVLFLIMCFFGLGNILYDLGYELGSLLAGIK